MPGFPLPAESTNIIKLADWMELNAVREPDENFSRGDLDSALTTAAVFRRERQDEAILAVFSELQNRARAAGDAYPFEINGPVLQFRGDRTLYSAYLFCLGLSYFGWSTKRAWEIDVNPWLLFEELSAIAAAEFIGGKVYRFGTSRLAGKKQAVLLEQLMSFA